MVVSSSIEIYADFVVRFAVKCRRAGDPRYYFVFRRNAAWLNVFGFFDFPAFCIAAAAAI
jgi:hypothetical protein